MLMVKYKVLLLILPVAQLTIIPPLTRSSKVSSGQKTKTDIHLLRQAEASLT
jgi:hypothetical protein